jgi:hypothetical protein
MTTKKAKAKAKATATAIATAIATAKAKAKAKAKCGGLSTALRFGRDDESFGEGEKERATAKTTADPLRG